jgi:acyl dehydratase
VPEKIQDGTIRVLAGRHRRRQVTHTVDDRWLVAFAEAVGDTRAELCGAKQSGGIAAHPVFPACLEWPLVADGAPGIELTRRTLDRGLHVVQSSTIAALIVPATTVTTTSRLVVAEQRSTAVHIATEFTTVDEAGRCVCVTRTHMLYPGAVLEGGRPTLVPRGDSVVPRSPELVPVGKFEVSEANAVIYTECARIWNPIHTDPRVAKAAGLPAPVLHGTETLARAISEVTTYFGRAVTAVTSYSCRFTAPVIAGDRLVVMASPLPDGAISFEVCNDIGVVAIADGILQVDDGSGAPPGGRRGEGNP